MTIITLTTDFDTTGHYVAAMKGVIYSINPEATVVDITHRIPPQNVRRGAIVWAEASRWFPQGTIHVAVVDPGVGTDRAIVYAAVGRQHFIAPNNGLLTRVVARRRPERLVRVSSPELWLPDVSSTFHGRDIMAPVAARLSLGLDPERLGPPLEQLELLPWPEPTLEGHRIVGQVIDVDSFGNLITNIEREHLAAIPDPSLAVVGIGQVELVGIASTYGSKPPGELVALVGSSGCLEVAEVKGNAAQRFEAPDHLQVTVRAAASAHSESNRPDG